MYCVRCNYIKDDAEIGALIYFVTEESDKKLENFVPETTLTEAEIAAFSHPIWLAGNIPYLVSKADETSGLTGGMLMYSSSESPLMVRGMRANVSGNTFTVTVHKTLKTATNEEKDSTSSLNAVYSILLKEA